MGYRLNILNPDTSELICNSKLFGYIEDDELKESKALRWLIDNHKLDDYEIEDQTEAWIWEVYATHEMLLSNDEFIDFITCYIMDRNRFYFKNNNFKDKIDYYEDALKLPYVKLVWY